MIIGQILTNKIKNNKLSSLEHELLLAHVLKKPREYILAHPEYEMTKLQIKNYELRIKERISGVPLAYITGEKEFYGFNFKVNKNVLIPRPETELMVEEAIKLFKNVPSPSQGEGQGEVGGEDVKQQYYIIDVGTGSGCIIISLVKLLLNHESRIINQKFIGIDISAKALSVAKKNAKLNKVDDKIKFIHGNLIEPFLKIKSKIQNQKSKIIITANLPYLTPTQIKNSPSIKNEPSLALSAGIDGLKYYRRLFKQIVALKKMLSAPCYVLCEIDPRQKNIIIKIIKKELPEATFEIKKDLKGHSRLAIINI